MQFSPLLHSCIIPPYSTFRFLRDFKSAHTSIFATAIFFCSIILPQLLLQLSPLILQYFWEFLTVYSETISAVAAAISPPFLQSSILEVVLCSMRKFPGWRKFQACSLQHGSHFPPLFSLSLYSCFRSVQNRHEQSSTKVIKGVYILASKIKDEGFEADLYKKH